MRRIICCSMIALAPLALSAQSKSGGGGGTKEGPVVSASTGASMSGMGGGWGSSYNASWERSSMGRTPVRPGVDFIRVRPADPHGTGRGNPNIRTIDPPMQARTFTCPTEHFWKHRDLMAEMRAWARRGCIPVVPVDELSSLEDVALLMAGWKAYGMTVPPKETVSLKLDHSNRAWFRLSLCNKWGDVEPGMLHTLVQHPFNSELKYTNPYDEPRHVYFVVDDPGWMSSLGNPYTLTIQRSWNPGQYKQEGLPLAAGIWAVHRPGKPSPKLAVALWR